jgi:triphosphoribosyl-dephospho-CoA synthetase
MDLRPKKQNKSQIEAGLKIKHTYELLRSWLYLDDAQKTFNHLIRSIKGGEIDTLIAKLKAFSLETNYTKKTDTHQTTITLSTLRTSAAFFRRVGICA